ncbi:MAG: hypothetical protein OXN97_17185 [Bryobacterales bacterium]|nr:hypothetical protein [Bryobacterales bacterium]
MRNQQARGSGKGQLAVAAPGRVRNFLAYLGMGGRAERMLPLGKAGLSVNRDGFPVR